MKDTLTKTSFLGILFILSLVMGFFATRRDGFMQKPVGTPIKGEPMGPYDGVAGGWMSNEMPVEAAPQNKSVEGNDLMLFVGNKVDKSCCPSMLTSDQGCICLSKKDESLMATRGGNK